MTKGRSNDEVLAFGDSPVNTGHMPQSEQAPLASALARVQDSERRSPDQTGEEIRTFLIADVRGYTHFTQERGDEAAARLASRFAEIVREQVQAREGSVIELRGDEALAVFRSPRQAIRAAVELQARILRERRTTQISRSPWGSGWMQARRFRSRAGIAVEP